MRQRRTKEDRVNPQTKHTLARRRGGNVPRAQGESGVTSRLPGLEGRVGVDCPPAPREGEGGARGEGRGAPERGRPAVGGGQGGGGVGSGEDRGEGELEGGGGVVGKALDGVEGACKKQQQKNKVKGEGGWKEGGRRFGRVDTRRTWLRRRSIMAWLFLEIATSSGVSPSSSLVSRAESAPTSSMNCTQVRRLWSTVFGAVWVAGCWLLSSLPFLTSPEKLRVAAPTEQICGHHSASEEQELDHLGFYVSHCVHQRVSVLRQTQVGNKWSPTHLPAFNRAVAWFSFSTFGLPPLERSTLAASRTPMWAAECPSLSKHRHHHSPPPPPLLHLQHKEGCSWCCPWR